MSDEPGEDMPPEPAPDWDSVRRVREPVAWVLLAVAVIAVLVSAWQLLGLPGNGLPAGPVAAMARASPVLVTPGAPATLAPGPVTVTPGPPAAAASRPVAAGSFGFRASAVAMQFAAGGIVTLTVLSVILVAFAGGRTVRARPVVQTAVSVLAVALGLGVVTWIAALGARTRPGVWFVFDAADLATVAAALIFAVAVLRSRALRRR